ncbi:MAG: hypothetical protein HGA78_06295 [Nitrospirales bacterium]|nr:hypothetical protein [Nitrospirales bacterium]
MKDRPNSLNNKGWTPEDSGNENHGEGILADVSADLFRGVQAVTGRLKITSRRVLFEPRSSTLLTIPTEILFNDITDVTKQNTKWIIPNMLLIRTKTGIEYPFIVKNREKLLYILRTRTAKDYQLPS